MSETSNKILNPSLQPPSSYGSGMAVFNRHALCVQSMPVDHEETNRLRARLIAGKIPEMRWSPEE